MSIVTAGWTLMGYGLLGVFVALILFFGFTKLLLAISKRQAEKKAE